MKPCKVCGSNNIQLMKKACTPYRQYVGGMFWYQCQVCGFRTMHGLAGYCFVRGRNVTDAEAIQIAKKHWENGFTLEQSKSKVCQKLT